MFGQNYGQLLYETEEEKRQRLARERAMQQGQQMPVAGPVVPGPGMSQADIERDKREQDIQNLRTQQPQLTTQQPQVTTQQP